jgi:hypothetical protein
MDGQACLQERILDNPAASDERVIDKCVEGLTSAILEVTPLSFISFVCQDEMRLNCLANVQMDIRTGTSQLVISVTAMKNVLF